MGRKMNFFLSALLVLVFGMGLSTCSYASQPSLDEMIKFVDLIKVKQNSGELFSSNKITGDSTSIATQFLNLTSDIDYTLENVIYLTGLIFKSNGSWVTNGNITGVFVIANNSFSNNLPFLYIEYKRESTPNLYTTNSTGSDWGTFYTIVGSNVSKYENCTFLHYRDGNYEWSPNTELTVLTNNVIFTKLKTASIYVKYSGQFYPMLNNYGGQNYNEYYGITEEPEQPEEPDNPDVPGTGGSTGNITNPSGDTTGKVDLSGIENGISDINQNIDKTNEKLDGISGEIGKLNQNLTTVPDISDKTITSDDITGSFDFEFAEDPYSNFWLELTTGLSGALTNNVRSIDVQFRNKTYQIHLDNFAIQVPQFLKSFLAILSTVFIFWKMIKYWKIIIDNITSGNMDEVLEMNEEERNN